MLGSNTAFKLAWKKGRTAFACCRSSLFHTVLFGSLTFSCTKPFSQLVEERNAFSFQDYDWLHQRFGDETTIKLTLDEAIEIALYNNLELQALQADLRVQGDAIANEIIKALPDLTYTSYNALRSNLFISSSTSVEIGVPPAPPQLQLFEND